MSAGIKKLFGRKKTSETAEVDPSATKPSPRSTGVGSSTGQTGRSTVPTGSGAQATTGTGAKSAATGVGSGSGVGNGIGSGGTTGGTTGGSSTVPQSTSTGVNSNLPQGARDARDAAVAGTPGTEHKIDSAGDTKHLGHTDSISQRYHPSELEPIEPRRAKMDQIVEGANQLPPGPDAPFSKDFDASYDRQPWELAQEKTRQAEREAASANLAAEAANKALRDAQAAEKAVHDAGVRHGQLLSEAEKQQAYIQDPDARVGDYKRAKELLAARQLEAERHNKALAELEAEVQAKKKDFEENLPLIEQHHKKVSRLTEEYDEHVRKQDAVEGDKERLLALANEGEAARNEHAGAVDRLTHDLMKADDFAAEKERDFINAKEQRRIIAQQLAEAKDKHGAAEEALMGHKRNADQAVQSMDGYVEKSTMLRRQLDEYEEEHTRMVNLERDRRGEYDMALTKLEGLRGEGEPKRHALAEAEAALNSRRAALEEAQNRARDAENRYKSLMREADDHATRGNEAAQAAKKHLADFDNLRREAQLHGDRHKELWNEAMQHGNTGSSSATSAFQKLEQEIKQFMPGHHGGEAQSSQY